MKKRIYPFCDYCERSVDSFSVMPIHQHDPKCPIRIKWEKKNPNYHPGFHGREWKEVINEGTKKFYKEASK